MSDYLVRGLGLNDEVRIFAVDTTDTINEAVRVTVHILQRLQHLAVQCLQA